MKLIKYLFLLVLSIFILFLVYLFINFNTLNTLVKSSFRVKDRLNSIAYNLEAKNFSETKRESQLLNLDLLELQEALSKRNLLFFLKQQKELLFIVNTSILLNNSFFTFSNLADNLAQLLKLDDVNILDDSKKERALLHLIQYEPEIRGLQANLSLVNYKLTLIKDFQTGQLFSDYLNRFSQVLEEAQNMTTHLNPVLSLLPSLIGYPNESRFLILFQNNDELRPTGGFIGSYATLSISDFAQNIDMQTGDIYHLDMPSIEHLETVPPEPIAKYMNVKKWYLRDSNWSPDWPTSAAFIEDLFYQEAKHANLDFNDLTAIFAITPDLVSDLISMIGDIEFEGQIYTPENLQELLQYQVEVAYIEEGISSWDRKNIMNDLALIIKERLKKLNLSQLPELANIINQAISRKDLLIYYTKPSLQEVVKQIGADGSIVQIDSDYLMIVDANLAAFKTDSVMKKDWYYNLTKTDEGLRVDLSLNYEHQGGFDWRTTRYRSYTRVLVPKDARFLSLLGNYQDFSETKEFNKKVFGFFISIEPGTSQQYTLSYLLPDSYINNYQLYLQRQPGSRINSVTINFPYLDYYLKTDLESDQLIRVYENSASQ